MENKIVTVERVFDASAKYLWSALTEPAVMKEWYFDLPDFKAVPGHKFQFTGGPPEKQYLHLCEVTEVVPERKLAYSWRYDGYAGNSFVTFELFPQGEKTLLKLTHTGIGTFPSEITDFAMHNFETGWNEIIHTSLKDFFAKKTSNTINK